MITSRRRSESVPKVGNKAIGLDPKPGELTMNRLNPFERKEEDRTRDRSNDLG